MTSESKTLESIRENYFLISLVETIILFIEIKNT